MTPEQAQALYFAGEQAVVERLCALDAQLQAAQQEIEALQRKVAQLSKDCSNSSKRPSSDDITKPRPKKIRQPTPRSTGQGQQNRRPTRPSQTHPRAVSTRDDLPPP